MQNIEKIPKLVRKYLSEEITIEEREELNHWVAENDFNRQLFHDLTEENSLRKKLTPLSEADMERIWNKIANQTDIVAIQPKQKLLWKYLAAASVVIFFLIGGYSWFNSGKQKEITKPTITNTNNNDVLPGTEKAVLTLADGTKITLDNTANGTIAQQGNTVIMKEDGLLAYNVDKRETKAEILYNTLTTARGEEFRSLVLPDGTKVWLNSVSSIHFPTAFIGKERTVEITGEVYFEVAKNIGMPFKVTVNGMHVKVVGTHFNINAYEDEATIKTTLFEGLIKIVVGEKENFLKPGQQAILRSNQDEKDEIRIVNDVNLDEVIAWKKGYFEFQDAAIETIMRQVARWYNVEVQYEGKVSQLFIGKRIPRSVNVSALFEILESTGWVHFKIEGKKITVMP